MGRRRIQSTPVSERASGKLVTPYMRTEECARKRSADTTRLVLKMQIPELVKVDSCDLRSIPAPANENDGWGCGFHAHSQYSTAYFLT